MAERTITTVTKTKTPENAPHQRVLNRVKQLKEENKEHLTPTLWLRLLYDVEAIDSIGFSKQLVDGRWQRKGTVLRGVPPFDLEFLSTPGDHVEQWIATNFGDGNFICYGMTNQVQTAQINVNVGLGITQGAIPETNASDQQFDKLLLDFTTRQTRIATARSIEQLNKGEGGSDDMKLDLKDLAELIKAVNPQGGNGTHDPEMQRLREELILMRAKLEAGANPMNLLASIAVPAFALLEKKPSLLGFISRIFMPATVPAAENPPVPGPTLMEQAGEIAAHPAVAPLVQAAVTWLMQRVQAGQAGGGMVTATVVEPKAAGNVIPFPIPVPIPPTGGAPMLDIQGDAAEQLEEIVKWIGDAEYEAAFDALRLVQNLVIREWCLMLTPVTNAKGHALALRSFHPSLKTLGPGALEAFVQAAKDKVEVEMRLDIARETKV